MFLLFLNKDKIFYGCAVPVKNALLVQGILVVLFRSKIGAKKFSSESELENHCNYIIIKETFFFLNGTE